MNPGSVALYVADSISMYKPPISSFKYPFINYTWVRSTASSETMWLQGLVLSPKLSDLKPKTQLQPIHQGLNTIIEKRMGESLLHITGENKVGSKKIHYCASSLMAIRGTASAVLIM